MSTPIHYAMIGEIRIATYRKWASQAHRWGIRFCQSSSDCATSQQEAEQIILSKLPIEVHASVKFGVEKETYQQPQPHFQYTTEAGNFIERRKHPRTITSD